MGAGIANQLGTVKCKDTLWDPLCKIDCIWVSIHGPIPPAVVVDVVGGRGGARRCGGRTGAILLPQGGPERWSLL